jgi:virginiamycin B lyase
MRRLVAFPAVALLALPLAAQGPVTVPVKQFEVPWGREGRPRDPAVHPDGSIFFVGQAGNYIARLDPRTGTFRKYAIDENAHPHSCLIDAHGIVWYSGNTNGTIGRLDPKTGEVTRFEVPEGIKDPHTMVWDKVGNMWFTAQNSNAVGYLDITTKKFRIVKMPQPGSRPYGIVLDSKGRPWFALFGTNTIGTLDPKTFELKTYPVGTDRTRDRRIAITSDDKLYYTDYTRGYLGRLDPATGKADEWALPGGQNSLPYGMAIDDRDRVWVAESNPDHPNRLVGFDPKTQGFFSVTEVPGDRNTIRYMIFDRKSRIIWFGADAGYISRADVSGANVAM